MNERKLTKAELKNREDIIMNMKGNKRDLVKKYGKDAEAVMYGRATNMAKKQSESMKDPKLTELIKDALKNPKKADLNKDGKLSDYEKNRGAAIEKNLKEENIGLADLAEMGYEAGKESFDMHFKKSVLKNRPDTESYTNGFTQAIVDRVKNFTFNENYKPSLRAYNVIDGKRNVVYSKLSREEAIAKARERADYKFTPTDSLAEITPANENEGRTKMPTQDQVNKFFSLTQNEMHYLNSKPVAGQEKTFNDTEVEPWDEYDLSNFNSLVRKSKDKKSKDKKSKFKKHGEMAGFDMRGINENEYLEEDIDLGHQDNEPGMLKADLYHIGSYAMELYKIMDDLEGQGEIDFPHWWQSKITTAKIMIAGAKHYLEFELKEPAIDAVVDIAIDAVDEDIDAGININKSGTLGDAAIDRESASGAFEENLDMEAKIDALQRLKRGEIDTLPSDEDAKAILIKRVLDKLSKPVKEGLPKGYWDKKMDAEDEINEFDDKSIKAYGDAVKKAYGDDENEVDEKEVEDEQVGVGDGLGESYNTLVNKIEKSGKSKKSAKAIAGAIASYKAKGGGKGPTAKQK